MKCIKCESKKNIKAKLVEYDYSKATGCHGVIIENVKEYTCKECKTVFYDLGDSDDIDKQIATILAGQPVLTRAQAKWVRTHYLGLTYFEYAEALGVDPHLIRAVENLKKPLSVDLTEKILSLLAKKLFKKRLSVKHKKNRIELKLW